MNDEAKKTDIAEDANAEPVENAAPGAEPQPQDAAGTGASADAPPEEISLEEFQNLKARAAKADEHWSQLVRVSADFDNYKKRAARERQESIRFANEAILEKLIPVLDNFEMALQAASDPKGGTVEALKTGVTMIHTQLRSALTDSGLEEIEAAGKAFDPNWHEAVSQQETSDVPEGHVLQQLRKGYKLRDRLIRPATVIVAKKASA